MRGMASKEAMPSKESMCSMKAMERTRSASQGPRAIIYVVCALRGIHERQHSNVVYFTFSAPIQGPKSVIATQASHSSSDIVALRGSRMSIFMCAFLLGSCRSIIQPRMSQFLQSVLH